MTTYTLNDVGIRQIKAFLGLYGKETLIQDTFFADAEAAADDAWNAERVQHAVIEIAQRYSNDGRPHVLVLEQSWFDAAPSDV